LLFGANNLSFSLLGRIRLAAIEGVCGANAFVMIGGWVEQDRVISRGLTRRSLSDAYPPTNTSLHMLAAFDFTVGGDSATVQPNERPDYQPCVHSRLVFTVRHGLLMSCVSSFHSAAETILSLQARRSFCVCYSCRFVFFAHRNSNERCQFFHDPNAWLLRSPNSYPRRCENERLH
jgi:hypothetical protein